MSFSLLKQLAHDKTRTDIISLLNLKKGQLDVKVTNIGLQHTQLCELQIVELPYKVWAQIKVSTVNIT